MVKDRTELRSGAQIVEIGNAPLVKGKLREKAGQIINSPGLEAEGQMEKTAGKVQQKVGQIEEVFDQPRPRP